MTDEDLIARLRSMPIRGGLSSVQACHVAADRLEALVKELASGSFYKESDIDALMARADKAEARAERLEAALREAAALADQMSVKWWAEYKDRMSDHCADPHYQGMSDGADEVGNAILALIQKEKPHDR